MSIGEKFVTKEQFEAWVRLLERRLVTIASGGGGASAGGGGGSGGGVSKFIELTDTPASYIGQAEKVLKVNGPETAIEFEWDEFINLSDVPTSYVGQGKKFVCVKSTADGLEFLEAVSDNDEVICDGDEIIFD